MQSQRDFFYAVLSQDGLPCLAWLVRGKTPDKSYFKHTVYDNIEQFCEAISELDLSKHDYYFAVSTLREKSIEERGETRVRTKTNALKTRCLILDVDLKDGHYKTVDEVIEAANNLAENLGIPYPIVVNSGYGAHVYWPFAEGIESKDWIALAKQFKKYNDLLYPGLVADSSRVSDSASVLRIPYSYNLKNGGKVAVEIAQWNNDEFTDVGALKQLLQPASVTPQKPSVSLVVEQQELPPGELTRVLKNCNWLGEYIKNQAEASEPEWYAALGAVPYIIHTTDTGLIQGDRIAQAFSKGHPDYDPETVSNKYNQVRANQSGPTTCERFRGLKSSPCETCPFAATVKTPIQTATLARPAEAPEVVETVITDESGNQSVETVTIPLYPHPYFRGEDGGVFTRVRSKDEATGEWDERIEKVYDYDLYPVKRFRTELLETEVMEVHVWLPKDGLRVFKLPSALLAEQKKLAIYLAERGVVSEHGRSIRLAKYLVDYIRDMQKREAAEVEYSRFGWRDLKSSNPKFVVGNGYINKSGELCPASFAHFLKDSAKATVAAGTIEEWKRGFAVYENIPNSEPFILAALMAFAAPLMAFTEYPGVMYNMVGETSAGKSTALKVMTSVFGQPNPIHVKIADNIIPVYNFIGYLNAIPVAMDELSNMLPERLSDFALSFTGGRGKMRANRDGTNQVNNIEWDTIVVATSNTSLYDKLAANRKGYSAEAMRIFEVWLPDKHDIRYQDTMNQAISRLNINYGHGGREFIKYIIQNIPQVQLLVDEMIRKITERGTFRPEERFWAAMFANVAVSGQIAKKLGLHNYDVMQIVDWGLGQNANVRETIKTSVTDPISLLSEFFNSNLDSILKFKDGRPHLGSDGRAFSNIRAVKVRMELDADDVPDTAWISRPALGEYFKIKNIQGDWLRGELKRMGVLREENVAKRLASGSSLATNSSIKCWNIDMKHPRMLEVSGDLPTV